MIRNLISQHSWIFNTGLDSLLEVEYGLYAHIWIIIISESIHLGFISNLLVLIIVWF